MLRVLWHGSHVHRCFCWPGQVQHGAAQNLLPGCVDGTPLLSATVSCLTGTCESPLPIEPKRDGW